LGTLILAFGAYIVVVDRDVTALLVAFMILAILYAWYRFVH